MIRGEEGGNEGGHLLWTVAVFQVRVEREGPVPVSRVPLSERPRDRKFGPRWVRRMRTEGAIYHLRYQVAVETSHKVRTRSIGAAAGAPNIGVIRTAAAPTWPDVVDKM
ncbi:hypothetical protein GDO81_024345 [Engystomops pustulosus]|uniref:Uncharacterized protein n=1 Tax=Engystomops pustulosus TaxID=76066 RepID=A0AAV6YRE1_ENGPU|nr:hypothetical protein GDO81_024345 [Engystomops pustulosus]